MICPKCKKEIPEKSLKCTHCGARLSIVCKKCRTYNSIYNLNCTNCHNTLLKICPSCKSVNFPDAKVCRKCGNEFEEAEKEIEEVKSEKQKAKSDEEAQSRLGFPAQQQEALEEEGDFSSQLTAHSSQEIIPPPEPPSTEETSSTEEVEKDQEPSEQINLNYDAESYSQQIAKELLIEGFCSPDKKVISLSGQKGIGKSIVLRTAIQELKDQNITWLFGECSPITQLSPCGLIQDILLTFFNVTNICSDSLKLKRESQSFFQTEFPTLTNEEIFNLLNFLYPTNADVFENILQNKEKTFTFLQKVFNTIIDNKKTIFVVENFDLIDGLSYEFLHTLLNNETRPFKILHL